MRRQKILLITTMVIISTMLSACWPMGSWDWSFSGSGSASGNLTIEDANATKTPAEEDDGNVTVDNPALATQFAKAGINVTLVTTPEPAHVTLTPQPPTPTAVLSDPTPNVVTDWVSRGHSFEFSTHNRTGLAPTLVDDTTLAIEHGDFDATVTSGWSSGATYIEQCYDVKAFMASSFEVRGNATLVFVIHDSQIHKGLNVPDGTIIELDVEDGRFTIQDGEAQSLYNDTLAWICAEDAMTTVYIWSEQGYSGNRGVYRFIPEQLEDFVRIYYELINQGRWDETWNMLSQEFKAEYNSTGYDAYANWWFSVSEVEVNNITIHSNGRESVAKATVGLKYVMGNRQVRNVTETHNFVWTTDGWKFHYQILATEVPTRRATPTATAALTATRSPVVVYPTATATTLPQPTNTAVIVPTSTSAPASCTISNVSWNYQAQDGEYRFEWHEGADCAAMHGGPAPVETGGQIRHQERRAAGRNAVEVTCGFLDNGDGRRCDDPGVSQVTWIKLEGITYTAGQ